MRDVRKLAKIVADHSRQIKGLSGGPQAAYSSIEGGSMDAYDNDGKMRLRIGAQDDGTHAVKYVQGPPPPRPTAPVVSVDGPVVRVRWDGMLLGGHIPEDFARIDVHFALASDDLEDEAAVRGNLATSAGNETVLAATSTGTYRVGLVAMSQSRARSEMSEVVDVNVTLVDIEGALDAVVENARGGSNHYTPTPPPGTDHDTDRDLWFDTSEDEDGLTRYTPHRWDGQEWVSLGDERVQAIKDAQADFESDLNTVRDTADGKNRTFYQSTMPATPPARAGDLWFNTANGYRLHRNNGATFVEVADGRISEVEDAVENIDISGPLSEARTEWLADAAADAQTKAQNAADAAEAAAKLYADQIASGVEDVDLEGFKDYADNAAEQARQAAIAAAIAEARVIANDARDEALASALDADAVISQSIAQFESDLDLVRESADGKSRIVWSPNAPSGDGKAGDTWFRTSSNRIIGYWRHSGSGWVSMSLDPTVIPNLDAGKITSGFIDSERIAANSITADKMIVGSGGSVIPWSQVTAGATYEPHVTVTAATASLVPADPSRTLPPHLRLEVTRATNMTAAMSLWSAAGQKIAADPSAEYVFQLSVYAPEGASVEIALYAYDHGGSSTGSNLGIFARSGSVTVGSPPETLVARGSVPAGAFYMVPFIRMVGPALIGVSSPDLRKATGSTLIEDGAITTDKIQAGAVGATAIAAESIDASKIVAGGIQAGSLIVPGTVGSTLIEDGAITTSKIEAGAITAQSGIIASLDAGVINSGTIDTARLAAGSITADKMLVGSAGNLIVNPGFSNSGEGWSAGADWVIPGVGLGGSSVLRIPMSTGQDGAYAGVSESMAAYRSPVTAGQKYRLSAHVSAPQFEGVELAAQLIVRWYTSEDKAEGSYTWGSPISVSVGSGDLVAGEWNFVEGVFEAPDGAVEASVGLYSNSGHTVAHLDYCLPSLLPMVGSTLIEGGAITTEKIATGAITAESGVIGSLDAGKITVGEMDGARIKAGSIGTEQLEFGAATGDVLSVDALNFKTAVGLDIRGSSFRAGDAVEMTEDFGIRQFGPDGALNVSLPSDGSPAEFRGDLSARTLTATGRMSIQGPGAIASGGVLELESGVVPPVGPPSVSNSLQTTKFPPVADDESVWGLAWAGGSWWRGINKRAVVVGDRIERISPAGELEASFSTGVNPQGLTSIGDELFLLGTLHANSQGTDQVLVYSLTGTLKRRWEYPNYGTGTYQPGIGTDGTNIVIAQSRQDGRLTWRRYNKTTGALLAQVDSTHKLNADVVNILITQADYGTQRAIVTTGRETGAVEIYTPTGTHIDYGGWYAAGGRRVTGTAWASGKFHHSTAAGDVVTMSTVAYPNGSAGPDTNDWWAVVAWATGSAETTAGPPRRFTYMRRTDLRVTFGSPPEGATLARVYFARGVTEPPRMSFHRVGEVDATAEQSIIVQPTGWESLANPPASNTFPQSTPGLIRSGFGNYWVDGTGAGQWGPLTFNADGTMTSDQIPEWIPVTTFTTGFGPQTWGFVPAYRIWPDGKVEWRGVIAGTINGTVTPFTIPAEARPAQPVNKAAAASGDGGTSLITRIEFGPATEPDKLRVYRGDSDRTWASLDDTSYYLV